MTKLLKISFFLFLQAILVSCGSGLCSIRTGCYQSSGFSPIGVLDTSFNLVGIATHTPSGGNDNVSGLVIASDGKIIVSGAIRVGGWDDVYSARFTSSGILDSTFNGTGSKTTDTSGADDYAGKIAIQPDGKIISAGYASTLGVVLRQNSDGTADTTFNTTGFATVDIAPGNDLFYDIISQADGKIVAGGSTYNGGATTDMAVVRLNNDSSLDTTFNTTGKHIFAIGGSYDTISSLALQSDGKIVGCGSTDNGSDYDFAAVRLNTDGSLDTTFNTTGKVTIPFVAGQYDGCYSVKILSNGKILLAGYANNGINNDFAMVRLNSDGSLDTSFNSTGKLQLNITSATESIYGIDIQSDGKIIAAGTTNTGGTIDVILARFTTSGALDPTFNSTGYLIHTVGTNNDNARAVKIQSDGKIVVSGYYRNGANDDIFVARYR